MAAVFGFSKVCASVYVWCTFGYVCAAPAPALSLSPPRSVPFLFAFLFTFLSLALARSLARSLALARALSLSLATRTCCTSFTLSSNSHATLCLKVCVSPSYTAAALQTRTLQSEFACVGPQLCTVPYLPPLPAARRRGPTRAAACCASTARTCPQTPAHRPGYCGSAHLGLARSGASSSTAGPTSRSRPS